MVNNNEPCPGYPDSPTKRFHVHLYTCKNPCFLKCLMSRYASCTTRTTWFDGPFSNCIFSKSVADGASQKILCMSLSMTAMVQPGTCHEIVFYSEVLKMCGDSNTILEGMRIHDHIIRHVTLGNMSIDRLLVQMYVNCGHLDDAMVVFKNTCQRSASTWNLLVRTYVAQGDQHNAFKLFEQMQSEKVMPSKLTIIRLLSTCSSKVDLDKGRRLHRFVTSTEFKTDVFLGAALVSMYGKCGSIEDAWKTFNEMPQKDVVLYSVMMGVCVRCGWGSDALQLLNAMEKEGLKPDSVTFVCALDVCDSPSLLEEGEKLHTLIKHNGCELDVVVATALINMYGKCGNVEAACNVFDTMPLRNVVSWNSMLAMYVRHNQGKEAIVLLDKMRQNGVKPDRVTFVSVIDACAKHALLVEGEKIQDLVRDHGLEGDITLENGFLNMYGKCGNLRKARDMFNKIQNRDVVSWNTMIALYAQHDQGKAALDLLYQMQQEGFIADSITFASAVDACAGCSALAEGKMLHACLARSDLESDVFVRSALLNMYGKCGNLKEARILFHMMVERDVVMWNTMLALYAQHDTSRDAFELFAQMQVEGVKPDTFTFTCIFDACASSGVLFEGGKLYAIVASTGHHVDEVLGTSLVYMYGKGGDLKHAVHVFDRMYERDMVAWTAIIAMYAQHGQAEEACNHFLEMRDKGIQPDDVVFVSLLTACSHSGFFDEALFCFAFVISNHAASPATEHCVCMIDLFGRAGRLNEAEIILHNMPSETSAARFLSLLGACRYHIDVERGERAAKHVLEMDIDGVSSYVTLSNIYAAASQSCQSAH